jgi:hypothetical protein
MGFLRNLLNEGLRDGAAHAPDYKEEVADALTIPPRL